MTIESETPPPASAVPSRGPHTAISDVLARLRAETPTGGVIATAIDALSAAILAGVDEGECFLTVLIRTRGDRPETLRDALLCLASQTDTDFEVVLLVHDAPDGGEAVAALVAEYPVSFASRVRVVPVSGGGRSRPLNVGLHEARGRYISVFDDDDLVFAQWVETFHELARRDPGRIVRAAAATQAVVVESWPRGEAGLRSLSVVSTEYAPIFDPFHHYVVNHTPFMSYAFPSVLFRGFGLVFDEELPVLEDWDMLLRAATICGVVDTPVPTSIYRRWQQGSSSSTEHHGAEWDEARARVIGKLDAAPMIVPPMSASRIRSLLEDENAAISLRAVYASKSWRWAWPLRITLKGAARVRHEIARRRAR